MFKSFTHHQMTSEWLSDLSRGETASVRYQPGLIAGLRAEQDALRELLGSIGEHLERSGGFALEGRLELLESRFRRYLSRELGELFAFLEPALGRYGLDEGGIVEECRTALQAACRDLAECRRTTDTAEQHSLLRRIDEQLRRCFDRQRTHVYPLYHKHGIQQLRAA